MTASQTGGTHPHPAPHAGPGPGARARDYSRGPRSTGASTNEESEIMAALARRQSQENSIFRMDIDQKLAMLEMRVSRKPQADEEAAESRGRQMEKIISKRLLSVQSLRRPSERPCR